MIECKFFGSILYGFSFKLSPNEPHNMPVESMPVKYSVVCITIDMLET